MRWYWTQSMTMMNSSSRIQTATTRSTLYQRVIRVLPTNSTSFISSQRIPELSKDTFASSTTVHIQLSPLELKPQNDETKFSRNLRKQFVCSFRGCLKSYKKKHFLIDHERVHKGEKPYRCKHCDRTFYRVTDLKKHTLLSVCQ